LTRENIVLKSWEKRNLKNVTYAAESIKFEQTSQDWEAKGKKART